MFNFIEKPNYTLVPDGDFTRPSSEFQGSDEFSERDFRVSRWNSRSLKTYIGSALAVIAFLIPYTLLTVRITSNYWKEKRLQGASVIDCELLMYE